MFRVKSCSFDTTGQDDQSGLGFLSSPPLPPVPLNSTITTLLTLTKCMFLPLFSTLSHGQPSFDLGIQLILSCNLNNLKKLATTTHTSAPQHASPQLACLMINDISHNNNSNRNNTPNISLPSIENSGCFLCC